MSVVCTYMHFTIWSKETQVYQFNSNSVESMFQLHAFSWPECRDNNQSKFIASNTITWHVNLLSATPLPLIATNPNTVRCRYNAVNFITNIHKRHPMARPLGRGMGCPLWIQHLIDIMSQFLQLLMLNLAILDRVITALDCIRSNSWQCMIILALVICSTYIIPKSANCRTQQVI